MRSLILLFALFATACAARPNQLASIEDCAVQHTMQEGGGEGAHVEVGIRGAVWSRRTLLNSDVYLEYAFNLDPDPMAERRAYAGLSDHARLRVSFVDQYPPPPRSEPYTVEVQGEGLTLTQSRHPYEAVVFSGADLDVILGGASDIDLLLRDSRGEIIRRDRITRSELNQVDELIRALSARLPELFADPVRFCPPEEIVI